MLTTAHERREVGSRHRRSARSSVMVRERSGGMPRRTLTLGHDGRRPSHHMENNVMTTIHNSVASSWRHAALVAMILGAISTFTTAAHAGDCPAPSKVADGQG